MQNVRENWKIYACKLLQNANILKEVLYQRRFKIEEFPSIKFLQKAKDEQIVTEILVN